MLFTLALRNLLLHRGKTLVLGVIIAVGLYVLVLGNSLLDTITEGMERTYTRGFTGDWAVVPPGEGPQPMFAAGSLAAPSSLPDYHRLAAWVAGLPGVVALTPQLQTRAQVSFDENAGFGTLVAGIEPISYRQVFPDNLQILEGAFLEPGQEGILLTERTKEMLESRGKKVSIGGSLVLTNRNPSTGFKAREVTVRGVFRFTSENAIVQRMSLTDARTARILAGLNEVPLAGPAMTVPLLVDPEEAFLTQNTLEGTAGTSGIPVTDHLRTILAGSGAKAEAADPGTWNYLLIRAPKAEKAIADQLHAFLADGSGGQVQDWVTTVGPVAEVAVGLRLVFNSLVLVVGLVALLVIMNSLVISVTERVPEIGTIRALGGQRSFVRALITAETVLASVLFGGAGIALAALTLTVLGQMGLRAPNEMVATLMGGAEFHPSLTFGALIQALGLVTAVGFLSSLYPVSVALRIPPVRAMQSN